MSNYLAIATVTAALRKSLEDTLKEDVLGAKVTTARPDGSGSGVPNLGANIYLYQVTLNASLRNDDMPNRSSDGRLIHRPQVALDLHYLLTFYGDDSKLEPQRLLGSVIRTLNSRPILTRQMIRATIDDQAFDFLKKSNLAEALETIKFIPASLSLEELSKLWSVFFQTPYRLSIAYVGTVVLIESDDSPQISLPVRERNLYVLPFYQPIVEQVFSAQGADQPIIAEDKLVIRGKKLRGDNTLIKVNETYITPVLKEISDSQILIQLPSGLQAGVQGLQVIHQMLIGTPPMPHKGVESNITAFVLHPTITEITVSNIEGTGDAPRSGDLLLKINPVVGKEQRLVLLLNEVSSSEAASYTFVSKSRVTGTRTITISFKGIKAADYLARVQVEGAQSQLVTDRNEGSQTFNQYIGPKVKI